MINTSNEYKQVILGDNRKFYGGATITLLDGTILTLDNTKITSIKIDDATSQSGQFSIGSAIINRLTLAINNMDDEYSDYDFTDAVIRPTIGLQLSSTIETLQKGVFTADDPKVIGSRINISARDNMSKFDKPFKDVVQAFPCTAQILLSSVCLHCGVVLATNTFLNSGFVISERPLDDAINCREIISWIAQLSGNFARCNTSGALELKWYDFEVFELPSADGGRFDSATPYASGDSVDGGNFTNYNLGDTLDGGSFVDTKRYHHIFRTFGSSTISTDDVVITGISVTESAETPTTALFGSNGYAIALEGNKLIQTPTQAQAIANSVGAKIVGMRFRPLSISALSDPSREAGDVAYVSDRKGNSYQIILSNVNFGTRQHDRISSDAEPPSRNSATRYSADSKVVIEGRKYTQDKITAYDLMVQQLNNLVAHSFGVYKTDVVLPDGSTVYYMHDKPTLAESMKIWKQTADAFAVSTDGGVTYTAGFDVNGNAVFNVLSAIGINADWIRLGKLLSNDGAVLIDMDYGVANSDNFSFIDNIQDGFPLTMPFNIDDSVSKINKVLLKYTQQKFRTYSTTAESGGDSTSTSTSGGGVTVSSLSGGGGLYTSTDIDEGSAFTKSTWDANGLDGQHTHQFSVSIEELQHSHLINLNSHTHNVVIQDHSHDVDIPSHIHNLDFGIMETPITENEIQVYVDETLRSTVTSLQGIIDLTAWVATTGWHTIELRSTALKRISAQINIKSYIRN
jgi:hypothetical protein